MSWGEILRDPNTHETRYVVSDRNSCKRCKGFGAHSPATRRDGMWSGTNCEDCNATGRQNPPTERAM